MSSIMLKYQEVNIFNDMTSIINISQNVTMSLHLKQLIYLFLEMLLYLTCICHSFKNLIFLSYNIQTLKLTYMYVFMEKT